MVRDSMDEEGRKRRKTALCASLGTNPIYEPYFEERFGELVRRGKLCTLFYNHPDVKPENDLHPLRDIWQIILDFHLRLWLPQRWKDGKIQIFTVFADFPNGATYIHKDILKRQFHYNKGDSIGLFGAWHCFLTELRDWKDHNDIKIDTMSTAQYWSTSNDKLHEWTSYQRIR